MGLIVCEPCGETEFRPTEYNNIFGVTSLIECVNCGTCRHDKVQIDPRFFYNSPAAYTSADRDYRHGASNNPDPLKRDEFVKAHQSIYRSMLWQIGWLLQRKIDSVYEVACAWGEFLKVARGIGVSIVKGCEVNKRLSELATSHLDVRIEWAAWQDTHVSETYDAVVMLDFIEHTLTPRADIVKARNNLKSDGILLMKTFIHEWHKGRDLDLSPNAWNAGPYNHKRGYFDPYCHPWHFTEVSLRKMLTSNGYDIPLLTHQKEWGQVTIYARPS